MKKLRKLLLVLVSLFVAVLIFVSVLPETKEQKVAKQKDTQASETIERQIKAISANDSVSEFISVSEVKYDGSIYQVWIDLRFEPTAIQQVRTWTDAVCESSKKILDSAGVSKSISVWARRPAGNGNVVLYGHTFYSPLTGKFEFKEMN